MTQLKAGLADYPFGLKQPDMIETFTGKRLKEITIPAILNDEISNPDIRISPNTLLLQAGVAEAAGRKLLADNFKRAAELCRLSDEKIIAFYQALRPFRSTRGELEAIAVELEHTHNAPRCADLFREAADIYQKRGFLKSAEDNLAGDRDNA